MAGGPRWRGHDRITRESARRSHGDLAVSRTSPAWFLVVALAGGLAAPGAASAAPRFARLVERTAAQAVRVEADARRAGNAAALDLAERARALVGQAQQALHDGRPRLGRDLALQAQRVLARAGTADAPGPSRTRVAALETELATLDRDISGAERALSRQGSDARSRRLLDAARTHRDRAGRALQDGDTPAARRLLRAGRRAALEAQEAPREDGRPRGARRAASGDRPPRRW